jgi:hypothetical protein
MAEKSAHPDEFFDSFNCVDVYIDEPGDTTVRPCDPRMLEHAKAERAKILEALAARSQAGAPQDSPMGD